MKRAGTLLAPPASEAKLDTLRTLLPSNAPADYFEFLRRHDGGDIWPDEGAWSTLGFDYLRLNSADDVIEDQERGWFSDVPELLVIGTDGGGQWLAFDRRRDGPWPLVMYCPGAPDHLNFLPVTGSVADLLTK